jgi:hypothetical protein
VTIHSHVEWRSLQVGWERFHPLEVVGFVVLLSGTSLYNEILRSCLPTPSTAEPEHYHQRHHRGRADAEVVEPLLGPPSAPQPVPGHAARTRPVPPRKASDMSGSDIYTMARSMRLGASALSPHSLDSYEEPPSSLMGSLTPASYGATLGAVDAESQAESPVSSAVDSRPTSQSNILDVV